jgi:integrase
LAGLRRRRVDLLHRELVIDPNEGRAVERAGGRVVFGPPETAADKRTVALPAKLIDMLSEHLAEQVAADPSALVFTLPDGQLLRRTKFRFPWGAACAKVGISGLHFHDLRGSGATWAATSGATVAELMARLEHSTPATALRYQHRDRAIADKLGALMRAAEMFSEPVAEVVSIERK